ncbi:hypothetical protein FNZ56_02915 [Pseudoluteimonas lycopersici]|uniref:Uncharacterized protein n=1 Tax=Pseudoluteimonas lycopersici TaxID=1324796 RepID=A0A516V307_9GAMM|nr:virulence factor TspB C-terminal domain-related protein [Lysobacter lycopersici]QDQ72902.1 hypothetical protein FNZ56_02915 [Lysobacter lycopersici]
MNNWLARVFVSALVRRCAYALVVLLSLYACNARAAVDNHPSRQEAYSHCLSQATNNVSVWFSASQTNTTQWQYTLTKGGYCYIYASVPKAYRERGEYKQCLKPGLTQCSISTYETAHDNEHSWTTECPAGTTWDDNTHTCKEPCSVNDPPLSGGWFESPTGSYESGVVSVCSGGCEFLNTPILHNGGYVTYKKIDGIVYISTDGWTATGMTCTAGPSTPSPGATPPPDSDGDGTSDANDGAPNNPGSTGGGSNGQGDNDGDGNDDGSDDNGDGKPDCGVAGTPACDDTKPNSDQSSGGGDCNTPPVSTGNQILASMLFQTWAIRCALQGNANGGLPPGNPNSSNMDLSETNGKLDTLHGDLTGHNGTGDLDDGSATGQTTPGSIFQDDDLNTELDQSGFGLARSCPAPPTFTIAGQTRTIDTSGMCDLGEVIGALVILAALAQAAWIFGGNR